MLDPLPYTPPPQEREARYHEVLAQIALILAHGCLQIDFDRGICGAAATTRQTQRVDSDRPAAFNDMDQRWLERLCAALGERYAA